MILPQRRSLDLWCSYFIRAGEGEMSFHDLESGSLTNGRKSLISGSQNTTPAVASGVFQINTTAAATFQRFVNSLGTPKNTPELRKKLQEVLLLDNEIVFTVGIIKEREQGEIQQQIGEMYEIFKDLAVQVHDQGIVIDDIDSNIDNCLAATSQAKIHLVKTSKTQKSNSSLGLAAVLECNNTGLRPCITAMARASDPT
ncbi:Syntaxin-22 [Platanthera guangdongensis]|uniref:Syntaxin-22 n=1 Tax=Platanthera guangdongensis TaxID=2320717 RepID=A0ABR2LMU8_9ASPA